MRSKTETPNSSPLTTFVPRSITAWLTEEIRPGKPYTGELTMRSTLVVSAGSLEMNSLISPSETLGFSTIESNRLSTIGIVGRLLISSTRLRSAFVCRS
jgi:hypothetical protein